MPCVCIVFMCALFVSFNRAYFLTGSCALSTCRTEASWRLKGSVILGFRGGCFRCWICSWPNADMGSVHVVSEVLTAFIFKVEVRRVSEGWWMCRFWSKRATGVGVGLIHRSYLPGQGTSPKSFLLRRGKESREDKMKGKEIYKEWYKEWKKGWKEEMKRPRSKEGKRREE